MTQPIRYARHRNSKRVYLTLALTWIVSLAVSSPIALGMNHTERRSQTPTLCTFYNSDFLIYSSMCSFYIPSIIMVGLYWRIFLTIRRRIKSKIIERQSRCPTHAKPKHKLTGSADANNLHDIPENVMARATIPRNENMADIQEARKDDQCFEYNATAVSPIDVPGNDQECLTADTFDETQIESCLSDVRHEDESKENFVNNDKTHTIEEFIQAGIEVGFVVQLGYDGRSSGAEMTHTHGVHCSMKRSDKRKGLHQSPNHPHSYHRHQQLKRQQSAGGRFKFFVRQRSGQVQNKERVFSKNEKKATKTLAIVLGEQMH